MEKSDYSQFYKRELLFSNKNRAIFNKLGISFWNFKLGTKIISIIFMVYVSIQ